MQLPRLTSILTWTVVGTYLLVALGATAATDHAVVIPQVHHAAAVVVGLLLIVTVVAAWTSPAPDSVRWGLIAVAVGYPIQASIGLAGVVGVRPFDGRLHLVGGVVVFAAVLVILVVQLEHSTPASDDDTDLSAASDGDTLPSTASDGGPSSTMSDSGPPSTMSDGGPSSTATDGVAATTSNGLAFLNNPDSTNGPGLTVRAHLRAYLELTKPRLMWLLCLLALAGMGLAAAAGASLDGVTVVATLAGGVLAIGAAGTFNHVYERDRDRHMARTEDRPVATATVGPRRAATFGLLLAVGSIGLLLEVVNPLAAGLTGAAIIYYSVVYTVILKPTTKWNTVIGGGAGALPAVIGYVAVAGEVAVPALLLAAVVFCWTPAHFYNLAIVYREDYAAASYPMLPVVAGVGPTRRRIVGWLGATLLTASLLGSVTDLGLLYAVTSTTLGGLFVWTVVRQYQLDSDRAAYRSFLASNAYLGCLLAAILVETVQL